MEFLLVVVAVMAVAQANPDAKRLYDDLLSNYNRLIRPVGNNSDRLTVKMGLKLSQLIDVVSTGLFGLLHIFCLSIYVFQMCIFYRVFLIKYLFSL